MAAAAPVTAPSPEPLAPVVEVETAKARGVPRWLDLSPEAFSGTVVELPTREDIKLPIQEQLIVELYSK